MQTDPRKPVLITGSAGAIGRAAVAGVLASGRLVRGFDRVPTPGLTDAIIGDVTDAAAVAKATSEVSAIIHLAAIPDDDDFMTRLLPNNIVGLYNVVEGARAAGVKRLVLASSGQVVWWQLEDGPLPIKADVLYTPRDWYAVTKITAEAAGMTYARNQHASVIAVRLGWFPRTPEHAAELKSTPRGPDVYFSPGDAARFFARTIAADLEPGFSPVYAASVPRTQRFFDMEPARRLLDWEPQDQWPTGSEHLVKS